MERLTESNPNWINDELWESAREPSCEEIDEVYRRLKHYEDLEEQGRLRTGGWIPVSCDDIKNPKDEQIVIGCRNNGEIAMYQFNWWDDVSGAFYRVDKYSKEVESERMWDDEVIAWQPLPEPYKPMQEGAEQI